MNSDEAKSHAAVEKAQPVADSRGSAARASIERREFLALGGAAAAGLFASTASAAKDAQPDDELIAVWNDFCESLKAAAPPLLRAPAQTSAERARALRYLTRLISQTLDTTVEYKDPAFPRFYRSQDETSQQGGPNPDTSYINACISGDHEYRVSGRRGGVHFVTFSTMRGMAALLSGKPGFVDNLVGKQLVSDAQGRFEIRIGRERPAGYTGNFLRTTADTEAIAVREIFGNWPDEEPMELHIERIGGEGAMPPALRFDDIAQTLRSAAKHTSFMADYWVKDLARFASRPNAFHEYQKRDPEKRSIAYTPGGVALVGVWKVAPDEALLIEVEPPESPYWAYELGDYWFQVDYWNAFCGVNNTQMVIDRDGVARVVVAHADPEGWPNWLSTSGQSTGHMVFRWLESTQNVEPRVRVLKVHELAGVLPRSTARLTAQERAAELARRRAGLRRRWPV